MEKKTEKKDFKEEKEKVLFDWNKEVEEYRGLCESYEQKKGELKDREGQLLSRTKDEKESLEKEIKELKVEIKQKREEWRDKQFSLDVKGGGYFIDLMRIKPNSLKNIKDDEERKRTRQGYREGLDFIAENIKGLENSEIVKWYDDEIEKKRKQLAIDETSSLEKKEKEETREVQEEVVSPEEAEIPTQIPGETLEEEAVQSVEKRESEIIFQNIAELMGGTAKELEISRQLRGKVVDFLKKETQEWILESAKEWAREHSKEIEGEGFPGAEKLGDKVILCLYKEMGGMEEIEKEQSMKNLATILSDWENPNPTFQARFMALNLLNKRVEKLSQELKELDQVEDLTEQEKKEKEDSIKKEMEELFVVRKELTEKNAGRDLSKEAEKRADKNFAALSSMEEREKYVNNELGKYKIEKKGLWPLTKTIITKEKTEEEIKETREKWENFLTQKRRKEKLSGREHEKLLREFYKEVFKEDKYLKYAAISMEKKIWEFKNKKEADKFLERTKVEAGRKWEEDLNKQRKEEIKELIEAEINEAAESPENAINGIKGVCAKIRKRLIGNCIENLKKKPEEIQEVSAAIRPPAVAKDIIEAVKKECPVILKEQLGKEPICPLVELLNGLIDYLKKLPEGSDLEKNNEKIVEDFIEKKKKEGCYDLGFLEDLKGMFGWLFKLIPATYWKNLMHLLTEAGKPAGIKIGGEKKK